MKPEQQFYQTLRPHLPGFPERIENCAGAGTPDFHCIWEGRTYWVEAKAPKTKKWTLQDLVKPKRSLLEVSQIAWFHRYTLHGGLVFFVVKDSIGIHLFNSITNKIGVYPAPVDWSAFTTEINIQLLNKSD